MIGRAVAAAGAAPHPRPGPGDHEVRVHIAQQQRTSVFRLPLDIETRFDGQVHRAAIELRDRSQAFTMPAATRPDQVAIDPDEWVLKVLTLREER